MFSLLSYGAVVSIDYDSATPRYQQLAAILRRRIEAGEITSRLPGEKTLQQEFGLAVATVRKAVKVLRDEASCAPCRAGEPTWPRAADQAHHA